LAFGEGDAAGEAFTAGLGLLAGVLSGELVGEEDAAGGGVALGEFELTAGSQPAANMIENVARSRIVVRLINLMLELFISLPSFQ
jgi:hypothetical protein